MIEALGPTLARTLVGDAYNPDYRYELETDDAGMHLIIINRIDGTSEYRDLEPAKPRIDVIENGGKRQGDARPPLWKRIAKSMTISLLITILLVIMVLVIMVLVYLLANQ